MVRSPLLSNRFWFQVALQLLLFAILVLGSAYGTWADAQTTCTGSCTVTMVVTPAEIDQSHVDDLNVMFGWFVFAAIIVYCSRQLLRLFDRDPYES